MSIRLRELREELDLSQTEVAQALYISRQIYNFYENGKRAPKPDMLIKLADFYHVSVDYILDHTPKQKTNRSTASMQQLKTPAEHTLIKKYRSLSPAGQERILYQCDLELLAEEHDHEQKEKESPAG